MTQKNKILIFGGAGFIGHHLVNLLQSKHDICVYDNFNIFGITHERIKNQIIQDRTKQWYNVDTVNGSVITSNHNKKEFKTPLYPKITFHKNILSK